MHRQSSRDNAILQALQATEASAEVAEPLGIRVGAAVLEIGQVGYDAAGNAVEDAISWYRGDRYKYVGEIKG